MSTSENKSHTALVEECKNIALNHLSDLFGKKSIVSLVLYGSLARNEEGEEGPAATSERDYFQSDMDLVAIVKNIDLIKHMTSFASLSDKITGDLKRRHLLSKVSLILTNERKLVNAAPSVMALELKLNGKVIFGKEVIPLLPDYSCKDVPVRHLIRYVLPFMVRLLERLAQSNFDNKAADYGSQTLILKSMKKMTTGLVKAIIIKEGLPVNPFSLNEIKEQKAHFRLENATLLESLLDLYEELKHLTVFDSPSTILSVDMKEFWIELVHLFDLTLVALTGNKEFSSERHLFGSTVNIKRRLQLALYISPRFLGIRKMRYLTKAVVLVVTVGPDYSYLPLYRLFRLVPSLLHSDGRCDNMDYREQARSRISWLKSFYKSFEIWNLSSCIFADQF